MNNTEGPLPWFSGICLESQVAGQYTPDHRDGESSRQSCDSGKKPSLLLDGLAPITIFVGANNSGKSRLMRELFANVRPDFLRLTPCSIHEDLNRAYESARKRENNLSRVPERFNLPAPDWLQSEIIAFLEKHYKDLERSLPAQRPADMQGAHDYDARVDWKSDYEALRRTVPRFFKLDAIQRCYVPIPRGMRPPVTTTAKTPKENTKVVDGYLSRAITDYFEDLLPNESSEHYLKHEQLHIFTGLSLYADLQERMLSPEQAKRQSILDYQAFLSEHFFAGQPVLLVPALKKRGSNAVNDVVYLKIGDKDEYPIHDLGDGMQSLIICTYPIITETQPGSLFFLEEPDLGMHPSLQRTFLDVLKQYYRKMGHQFFLTTHSNHLLDLADDPELVSILSFSEITDAPSTGELNARAVAATSGNTSSTDQDQSAISSTHRFRIRSAERKDRELLFQLGVRPSATFLANATIWVEGVSDASYLRAYIEAFVEYLGQRGGEEWDETAKQLRQYKEDNHYAFVEYSGANLCHFRFEDENSNNQSDGDSVPNSKTITSVGSLCAHALLIADGDIDTKKDRRNTFQQQLKERLIVLPGKEVENLIPERFVKEQVKADHTSPCRGTICNEVLERISYAEYSRYSLNGEPAGLGGYLSSLGINKYSSEAKAGTLPPPYKSRWSSPSDGIPLRIRNSLQGDRKVDKCTLPPYITQDLIWLCTCIYLHIARCNQHKAIADRLQGLHDMIRKTSSTEADYTWPIADPADQRCLLHPLTNSPPPSPGPKLAP